jgi:adenylate cyclase
METPAVQDPRFARMKRRSRFANRDLEARFRAWHTERSVLIVRAGMVVAFIGGWGLAASSALFDPAFAKGFWPIAAMASPGFIAAFAVTWFIGARRAQQSIVIVAVLIWGLSLIWMLHDILRAPELGTTGLLLVTLFSFTVFRLPPPATALVVTGLAAVHTYLLATMSVDVNGGLPIHAGVSWAVAGASVFVAIVSERVERTQFVQEHVIAEQNEVIKLERERSDRLLRNVLPEAIADRLKDGNEVVADSHEGVTIMFADIVGFTSLSLIHPPDVVVSILDDIFTHLDQLADKHGVEKIKTVGDAYMAVAGAPEKRNDHAEAIANLALDIRDGIEALSDRLPARIEMRIGIATGDAIAGVIGRRRLAYDLWSDTVNTAARMESHGVPGRIQTTDEVAKQLAGQYRFAERGIVDVKGKGPTLTWFLEAKTGTV